MPSLIRNEVGNNFYVWTLADGRSSKSECVITAHGMIDPLHRRYSGPDVTFSFYCSRRTTLTDPGIAMFNTESANPRNAERVAQGSSSSMDEYLLGKYTNTDGQSRQHNGMGEDYAKLADLGRFLPRYDVVSVRNRGLRYANPVTLTELVGTLWEHGYRYNVFHCLFCRPTFSQMVSETLKGSAVPSETVQWA
ncbi:hypothetical protein NCH01_28460 [Neoasaia chiangmaiensis]|uniref:Uncharacterized protein n=2 Tax=Neoasaia chiangmaiensis TaxID=320497 RepID=A0A1U9KLR0_9PROT|nr:hypothetical protein [Neoasaia chiangmaiensis]AQS86734.1 hypothetical protein A0U93_00835 [Neoasaia chiangmaiensis]GEN16415.1 hypothetical protein NCH01_28460 [Neoasaia chiangmaiensis]